MSSPGEQIQARRAAPLTGSVLGRYRVGERLGVGGAASVYLARLCGPYNWERLLALKVVHEHLLEQKEFVDMFVDEATLAVRLNHPNIVHTYELGHDNHWLFLAMEYLDGQPLSSVLEKARAAGRQLPWDIVAWIGARAADALAYAHALTDEQGHPVGFVHRDVSPHNLFLTYDGKVKVIDFGIARARGRVTETGIGMVKGKFHYMAPEQLTGQQFDHRADLFALAGTLCEALTGRRAFAGEEQQEAVNSILLDAPIDPRSVRSDVPEALADVLTGSLAKEPENRCASAAAFGRELDACVAGSRASDQPARLAALLVELFAEERDQQSSAIRRLRADSVVDADGPSEITREENVASKKRRLAFAALFVVAAAGLVFAIAQALPSNVAPSPVKRVSSAPTSTPPTQTVTLDITVQPDVPNARISLDGVVVDARPARVTVDRSPEPVRIVVEADGYESADLKAVPDRDHFIVIPLTRRQATATNEELAPPSRSTEPEAKPPPSEQVKRPIKRPSEKLRDRKKVQEALVTDYPF